MKKNRKRKKQRRNKLLFLLGWTFLFSCNQVSKNNSGANQLNLKYHYQISALSPKNVKDFLEKRDTFPITAITAYKSVYEERKVQEILADTQYYKRKLLIDDYPSNSKKVFSVDVREFVDNRGVIIASFSVSAYTGDIFFKPKPFSKAYESGLWKIPINEWDSKLD